jgi:hypothetical protein
MMAFDHWIEQLGYEELGIEEPDENLARVAEFDAIRERIRSLPFDAQIIVGKHIFDHFVDRYAEVKGIVDQSEAEGLTLTQILDRHLAPAT